MVLNIILWVIFGALAGWIGSLIMGTDEEQRELMKRLGLNWTLSNKKVAVTPRKPLNLLHISNRHQSWRG